MLLEWALDTHDEISLSERWYIIYVIYFGLELDSAKDLPLLIPSTINSWHEKYGHSSKKQINKSGDHNGNRHDGVDELLQRRNTSPIEHWTHPPELSWGSEIEFHVSNQQGWITEHLGQFCWCLWQKDRFNFISFIWGRIRCWCFECWFCRYYRYSQR